MIPYIKCFSFNFLNGKLSQFIAMVNRMIARINKQNYKIIAKMQFCMVRLSLGTAMNAVIKFDV